MQSLEVMGFVAVLLAKARLADAPYGNGAYRPSGLAARVDAINLLLLAATTPILMMLLV